MDRYWLFLLPAMTFAQVTTAQVTTSDYDRALKTWSSARPAPPPGSAIRISSGIAFQPKAATAS